MTITDRAGKRQEFQGMHNGKGTILAHRYFVGEGDPSIWFLELVFKPGAYAGYHRHEGIEENVYIISGKAENFTDGDRCILGPGDALLTKSGQAHAIKNVGDEELTILAFGATPGVKGGSAENLPLPDELSDWG